MGRRTHEDSDYLNILPCSRLLRQVVKDSIRAMQTLLLAIDNLAAVVHSDHCDSLLCPPTMALTDPTRIRTTISVDKDVHQIFVRMAEASGMSVSKCMGEWLGDTADGAQFVAAKMVEARKAPMVVMREMQAMSVGLAAEVEKTMTAMRAGKLKPKAESAASASASVRPVRSKAPSSLTGLKSPQKGKK